LVASACARAVHTIRDGSFFCADVHSVLAAGSRPVQALNGILHGGRSRSCADRRSRDGNARRASRLLNSGEEAPAEPGLLHPLGKEAGRRTTASIRGNDHPVAEEGVNRQNEIRDIGNNRARHKCHHSTLRFRAELECRTTRRQLGCQTIWFSWSERTP